MIRCRPLEESSRIKGLEEKYGLKNAMVYMADADGIEAAAAVFTVSDSCMRLEAYEEYTDSQLRELRDLLGRAVVYFAQLCGLRTVTASAALKPVCEGLPFVRTAEGEYFAEVEHFFDCACGQTPSVT